MSAKVKSAAKKPKANEPVVKSKQYVYIFPDGSTFEGEIKEEQPICRHGKGKLTLISGNVTYQGDWANDKMHGKGKLEFSDGSFYEGEFKDNAFDGKGKFQWANNYCYEGQWANNLMTGQGVFSDPEQAKWQGQFHNGHGEALIPVLESN